MSLILLGTSHDWPADLQSTYNPAVRSRIHGCSVLKSSEPEVDVEIQGEVVPDPAPDIQGI